jgi:hypothetical protein
VATANKLNKSLYPIAPDQLPCASLCKAEGRRVRRDLKLGAHYEADGNRDALGSIVLLGQEQGDFKPATSNVLDAQ